MARRARNAGGEQSEAAFQAQVEQLAQFYGWRVYHTRDSRGSARGFPDLVMVRAPELVFAELKTDRGKVRPEQAEWLEALGEAPGVDAYLWRPADFDLIHTRLARGRARHEPLYR